MQTSQQIGTLSLDAITKRYGQGEPVIEGLSHRFEAGTATGLVGPNGSGKTTLLRMLAVTAYPTSGRVTLGDLDVHVHPHQYLQHVGVVYDEPQLPAYLTAEELLEWVLRARGRWEDGTGPDRVAALLDGVRLDDRRTNPIGTYSSGMGRKTQIAAALAPAPRVLLMDEPFRGLDEATLEAVIERLQAFKRDGGVLILSSHLRAPLDVLADDFLHMVPHSVREAEAS